MDPTVIQKFKDNLVAFAAGAIVAAVATWHVADTLNKREVSILERQLAELRQRIDEKDVQLKLAQQAAAATIREAAPVSFDRRKAELKALIATLDKELGAQQKALAMASPLSPDGPKGDVYRGIEHDIAVLKSQRDEARKTLIRMAGG